MSRLSALAAAFLLAGLAAPAAAHVTAHPDTAPAGSYFETAFRVPHGCDGAATTAVRVKIPDGVLAVKPQMKPGWAVTVTTRRLDPPIQGEHGRTVTETVDEVDWRGGPLPDNLYDTFGLVMKLPDMPGTVLRFPVVQECEKGVHRWIEIPAAGQGWGDLHEPAPFVRLVPKAP